MADTESSEKITLYFSTIPSNHEVNISFHFSGINEARQLRYDFASIVFPSLILLASLYDSNIIWT